MLPLLELEPMDLRDKAESPRPNALRAYTGATTAAPDSEDAMLRKHLPLVRSVVERMRTSLPSHVDVDDLYSVGVTGLVRAIRKYDPTQGTSFASYASLRIRGAVLDELRRMDWMSRGVRSKAKQLTEVIGGLEQRLGRTASQEEVAEELAMSNDEYAELLDEVKPVTYLELDASGSEDDEEPSLHEIIADQSQVSACERLQRKELVELMATRITRMPDMQKKVLAMYYFEDLRLAEIAQVFGVTESRICQIHSQAVLSLRTYLSAAMDR